MIFCYVILHYKTDKDTIECIQSIIESDGESQIVVVDNASNNGSVEKIEKFFCNNKRLHIIRNKENLGFAAGNNIGYQYARNMLHADFIAISNNDIIIRTEDFPQKVFELYKNTHFFVAGPDVVSAVDAGHQNPMDEPLGSIAAVKKEIWRYKLLLVINKMGIYDILRPKRSVRTGSTRIEAPKVITENVMLHGSFVIFSSCFIQQESISFRDGTFLYVEEAILKKYCDKKRYKTIFAPTLLVHHKEDSATNSLKFSTREKREFVFKNMINSLKVYLNYI